MSLSKAEKEEIITWSLEKADGITVFTHNPAVMRKLKRGGGHVLNEVTHKGKAVAWKIRLEHAAFSPRYPIKPRRASPAILETLQKARSIQKAPALAAPQEGEKKAEGLDQP